MREFRESDEPECKTCGACCVGDVGDYVPVTLLDRRRLPKKYTDKLIVVDGVSSLPLKRFGPRKACVALKGTLGKDINCDVYAVRPETCRVFERGGAECRQRRSSVFVIKS